MTVSLLWTNRHGIVTPQCLAPVVRQEWSILSTARAKQKAPSGFEPLYEALQASA